MKYGSTLAQWSIRLAAIGALCWLPVLGSHADSWSPPQQKAYFSPDKTVRLTVTPRELSGPLAYFEDKVDGKPSAGQRPGSAQTHARAALDRKGRDGRWVRLWDRELLNDVAPVDALVADSARHVVTFDDWHAVGTGPVVVGIYDEKGQSVKVFAIEDLLPEKYIEALPRSVSSISWSGHRKLTQGDTTLALQIRVPGDDKKAYVDFAIRLSDGKVTQPAVPAWERAMLAAAKVNAANDEANRAFRARLAAPLPAPLAGGERDWYDFMIEAYFRLYPGEDNYPATYYLPAERSAAFGKARTRFAGWMKEEFSASHGEGDVLIFSSPTPSAMAAVLVSELKQAPPGSLKGARLLFVGDAINGERVRTAAQPSGATYVLVDIAKPLPPRKLPQR